MAKVRRHPTKTAITAGSFFPLGATVQPDGVNFAIYSRDATELQLLLFDRTDGPPTDVIQVANRTKFVWHTFVAGVKPGQLYGYKVPGDRDGSDDNHSWNCGVAMLAAHPRHQPGTGRGVVRSGP